MDGQNDLNQRIADLRAMSTEGMTLGEVRDRIYELNHLEQQARMTARRPARNWPRPAPKSRPEGPQPDQVRQTPTPPRRTRERVSEQVVGRYVMTTLAAVLCLLAFGVVLMMVWDSMPNIGKFAIFLALGVGLEVLGTKRAAKKSMRPFWLGVAGLGAGISFIDLTAGCLFWGLYGLILTGVFVIAWFGANLYLGRKQAAGIFYIIAYIGGLMAVMMTCEIMPEGMYGMTAVILLTAVIAIAGFLEYRTEHKQYLLFCNMIFCAAVCFRMLGVRVDSETVTQTCALLFCVILSTWCLYLTRHIWVLTGKIRIALRAGIVFVLSIMAFLSVTTLVKDTGFLTIKSALFLTAILLAAYPGSQRGYFLGASPAFFFSLAYLSDTQSCGTLLVAIVLAAIVWVSSIPWYWDNRIALGVGYYVAMTRWPFISEPQVMDYLAVMTAFIMLLLAVAGYARRSTKQDEWFYKPVDIMILSVLPGISMGLLVDMDMIYPSLQCVVLMFSLYAYYFLYLVHEDAEKTYGAKPFWYVARILVYASLMANMLFSDAVGDKVVLTMAMMMAMGFNLYQAVHTKSGICAIAACILANWEMICLTGMWEVQINILISIIGILIAAGFIGMGFVLDIKSSRQIGLACAVLYAIKLGVFDVAGESSLGAAGGLLIAGLLCFGISLTYHKLGQRYEAKQIDNPEE